MIARGWRGAGARRRLAASHARARGIALVMVLLVLMGLTLAGLATMATTARTTRSAAVEVGRQAALYGCDAGAVAGRTWFAGQAFVSPPARRNAINIPNGNAYGFWNVRNFGGIGDGPSATVHDWRGITPDMVAAASTPQQVRAWYEIQRLPGREVRESRVLGEEAGRAVRYSFRVSAVCDHASAATARVDQVVEQTYSLSFYD